MNRVEPRLELEHEPRTTNHDEQRKQWRDR